MGTLLAKADLHLHSKASNLPAGWFTKLINCPESYAEPLEIYKRLKERGMSFVTITDHNTIDGVLEIAHLPDVFISCEYTVEFPEEEEAKVHVLVYGLEEKHHQDLIKLRENIYEFVSYLKKENLPHSLAHPLYSVPGTKLNKRIIDKLGLLFDNWEIVNGTRGYKIKDIEERIAKLYSGWDKIRELEERYGIKAMRSREYISFTAGSDDHGGMDVGRTWTAVEGAKTKEEFLRGILEGKTLVGSESLGEERLINIITRVGYGYIKSKYQLPESAKNILDYIFMYSNDPTIGMAIRYFTGINGDRPGLIKSLLETLPFLAYERFTKNRSLMDLGVLALSISFSLLPPFVKYILKKEERKIESIAKEFGIRKQKETKVAYFTDTYWDINGVARTAQIIRKIAEEEGLPFHFFISSKEAYTKGNLTSLKARLEMPVPFYEELKFGIPSMGELIEVLEREGFTHVHISTPGPLGIMAFVAAKILGLKASFAFHTDLPKYAYIYTKDEELGSFLLKFFVGVANLSDKFFVPSEYYQRRFIGEGVNPMKVKIFRRGVDTENFSPDKRIEDFWSKRLGKKVKRVILYVGRVAKEKNLDTFIDVAKHFPEETFVVVGDGPYRDELERKKPKNIYFVGYMRGEELSQAYASSYVFLFPSETETYALVILEAMASGLPVIVSSEGASPEHVKNYVNGFIATSKEDYVEKLSLILSNETLRNSMAQEARKYALSLDMRKTYLDFLHSIMGLERLSNNYNHCQRELHIKVFFNAFKPLATS